jgi:predicted amidohydrolase YtcJ
VSPADLAGRLGGPGLILQASTIHVGFGLKRRTVEALAIKDGAVVAAGSKEDAWASLGSDALHRDLGMKTVLPGFIDAHIHLEGYALARRRLRIDAGDPLEGVLQKVKQATVARPKGSFILGRGWDHAAWGGWPTASMLDSVAPDHPVVLTRKDGHAAWVNSAALVAAGIDAVTPAPEGGEIVFQDGLPSGLLKETAQRLVGTVIPAESASERKQALLDAFSALWRHGIVGCHDMGFLGTGGLEVYEDLSALRAEGRLGVRVVWYVLRDALDKAIAAGLHRERGDEWLRLGGLKLFLDGTLGSQTAHMLAPFEGQHENRGLPTMSPETFGSWISRARDAGLPTAVHAIGDAANRVALDGFSGLLRDTIQPPERLLHRIEHAQILHPDDIPRFAALGVIASMQPVHVRADLDIAEQFWGGRCRLAYAWNTLHAAGNALAFGSDAPIETASVFAGLSASQLRQNQVGRPSAGWYPNERLRLDRALAAYTLGAAAAAGQERTLGSLERGKRADLIVVDADPFTMAPESLAEQSVLATMLDGRWVFDALQG